MSNWGLANKVWELLASLWIPPLLCIPLSLLLANRKVSKLPLWQGEMAVFTGQVRRISQNLILFSSPLAMWEGVLRWEWEAGAWVSHWLTEKGGCRVTGDIPIDEILILGLFCIIYCLDHFSFLFFNITRKSLQIVLKQCKKKMFW